MTTHVDTWAAAETDVLRRVNEMLNTGRKGALATVVGVDGSAYRRPGARMVIPTDGDSKGSVTAGCVEDEVHDIARGVTESGVPRIETFDLRSGDTWGLGIGCDGVVDILIEPVTESLRPLVAVHRSREPIVLCAVVGAEHDALEEKVYYYPEEDRFDKTTLSEDTEGISGRVARAVRRGQRGRTTTDGRTVFIDEISPPPRLLVFGTGNDVEPVVETASWVGFRVEVVGFRGDRANPDRFPSAHEVTSTSPANFRSAIEVDDDTYGVVMTHNFVDDTVLIDELTQTSMPYIGLMGPKDRFDRLLDALAEEGKSLSDRELEKVYTPVGLNLGGSSPYGIALSIVAEVMAVHNGKDPDHLRDTEGPIHDRPDTEAIDALLGRE